ncbi:MAG: hypothetical protein WCR36_09400 [Bacteroidaceae bacterium]
MIWPVVNGFFSQALSKIACYPLFDRELFGLMHLALDEDKGNCDFYEIYNLLDGKTFGGRSVIMCGILVFISLGRLLAF